MEQLERDYAKEVVNYSAALALMTTRINNLLALRKRDGQEIPCTVSSRIKCFDSAFEKCVRKTGKKQEDVTLDDIFESENDIAGARICVLFRRHIHELERAIKKLPGMSITKTKDYLNEPKSNGYSSLHLIVQVEIYTEEGTTLVPVEIQLRTKAQDLWAELEHYLYKNKGVFPEAFKALFKQIAKQLQKIDELGEKIFVLINNQEGDATE